MNNFVQTVENKSKILQHDNKVFCGKCGEKAFAPFDKLLISAYGECPTCMDEKDLEHNSNNIFQIL